MSSRKKTDEDYFSSDEFRKRAEEQARESSFNIISSSRAAAIHENYLKNNKKNK